MLDPTFIKICIGLGGLVTTVVAFLVKSAVAQAAGAGSVAKVSDERFRGFQKTYLVVYLTAMMADWLQGPYVYALYESYGFTRSDNAVLFTCGFGSSAIFGTFVGALADRLGRRKFAALYCVLYGVSCATKHVNNFTVLLLGRLTGGIATSLLFSVFDSWMVSEHNQRDFDPELLGSTFSLAVFGNSLVAIAAGELGQLAADAKELTAISNGMDVYFGGYCSPFDVAILCVLVAIVMMMATWSENYGQKVSSAGDSMVRTVFEAFRLIVQMPEVLMVGIVCALFESSMFIFVFMWTPALTEEGQPKPPFGHIFASFMVMAMLGSQLFSFATADTEKLSIEALGRRVLVLAAASHVVPVVSSDTTMRFVSFLVFEMCVGLYFPMIGTLKGQIVPEESRSAIYNLYRLPLNIIVVVTLVAHVEMQTAFALTTVLLVVACFCQSRLIGMRANSAQYRPVSAKVDSEFGLDDDLEMTSIYGAKS